MRLLMVACLFTRVLVAQSAEAQSPSSAADQDFRGHVFDAASGAPVERAQIVVMGLGKGALTSPTGRFLIVGLGPLPDGTELVVEHPCFHTVRIDAEELDLAAPFAVGLPFRQPTAADGTVPPWVCGSYGPR